MIHDAKQRAVSNEEYGQAKQLREAERQIQDHGQQLAQYEQEKKEAAASEDYDRALSLKRAIDQIREVRATGDRYSHRLV